MTVRELFEYIVENRVSLDARIAVTTHYPEDHRRAIVGPNNFLNFMSEENIFIVSTGSPVEAGLWRDTVRAIYPEGVL